MSAVLIADLGRIVNPAPGRRVLALLKAYLASLANQPPRVSVVAGYVASINDWVCVEAEWAEGLKEWGLEYFHMTEVPRQIGVDKAALCETYFADILRRSKLSAVNAALLNADWEKANWGDDATTRLSTPYEQCLDFAFGAVGEFTNDVFSSEPVAIICCLDDVETNINAVFQRAQKQYSQFVSIAYSTGKMLKPLQCADLGAGMRRNLSPG